MDDSALECKYTCFSSTAVVVLPAQQQQKGDCVKTKKANAKYLLEFFECVCCHCTKSTSLYLQRSKRASKHQR